MFPGFPRFKMIVRQGKGLKCETHAGFLIQGFFFSPWEVQSPVKVEKEKEIWTSFQTTNCNRPCIRRGTCLHTFLISSAQVCCLLSFWVKASADEKVKCAAVKNLLPQSSTVMGRFRQNPPEFQPLSPSSHIPKKEDLVSINPHFQVSALLWLTLHGFWALITHWLPGEAPLLPAAPPEHDGLHVEDKFCIVQDEIISGTCLETAELLHQSEKNTEGQIHKAISRLLRQRIHPNSSKNRASYIGVLTHLDCRSWQRS